MAGESLQATLDRLLAGRECVRVLDAGCGAHGRVALPAQAHIVGLDISAEQLAKNQDVQEKVLGDIQTYEFPPQSFDVVICWELLEHVRHPERALALFARALKDDGVLVLAAPNVLSIKGLVTKFTPYRFHRWYYRRMYKIAHPPIFPTHLRLSMTPRAIFEFAARSGLVVEFYNIEESFMLVDARRKWHVVGWRWSLIRNALRGLSLGRMQPELTDWQMVLRRAPAVGAPAAAGATPGATA
ncbi:MAG: class I SAM-dependent methyltransferase [Dehalococcoidia bacterium]|nr:class I SAM-dependent methyltransferase [Dehalococcoidia bacterium]